MLAKRKRRILILARWHTQQCVPGTKINEIVQNFFEILLTQPIQISLYPEYFRIFPVNGLNIYYSWLFPSERAFIASLFKRRDEAFAERNFYMNNSFVLRGGVLPKDTFPIEHRRELLRDFVNMFLLKFSKETLSKYALVYVCQQMMLKTDVDRFVVELHSALQGRFDLNNLHCLFV